jgi:hypothetical protein
VSFQEISCVSFQEISLEINEIIDDLHICISALSKEELINVKVADFMQRQLIQKLYKVNYFLSEMQENKNVEYRAFKGGL